ncbi:Ig-like domain-containing protein [Clostridium sp. Marseille-P299]|uniref:Ig-like domain-containing protein n=1 Tax=Clostridium sp. Marseille-P299 TaxID=1805477 RepID=UPI00082A5CB0|nr:Ig-like domain-containing protein [Clostridium sp. Marseille-P299]
MREKKFSYFTKLIAVMIIIVMCSNLVPVQAASKNMWLKKYYITINVGKISTIGIKSNTTGKNVTYSSSDKKIATVSSKGVIKGVKAGKVTITVKAGNVSRKCIVTVKKPWIAVDKIEFEQEIIALDIGEKESNPATIFPSNASGKWITYSSSDPTVATVDKNGVVTGMREGKIIITAKGSGGVRNESIVYVSEYEYEEPVNRKPEVYDSTLIVNQGKVKLGMKKSELLNSFGEPSLILDSDFNCPVYIYNNDYTSLVFVYVKNDEVIGYYTNAAVFETCGVKSSFTRDEIYDITLAMSGCKTSDYRNDLWYDYNGNLISILVMIPSIDPDKLTTSYLPTASSKVIRNMERIYFELVNGLRGRNGIAPLSFDSEMSEVARKHSEDMTKRGYLDHITPDGITITDRLDNAGISYTRAGEIITIDICLSTVSNIVTFMRSISHRNLMLDSGFTNAGVGVSIGDVEIDELGNITIMFR